MTHAKGGMVRLLSAAWLATACCVTHSQMLAPADQRQEALPAPNPFDELNQWFAASRAQIAAGKMKPSDMYRGAYDRVMRFDDVPEKFLYLRDLSSMLDSALAWEHKKITKDEFDSAIRNADIAFREAVANLDRERQEQQARAKAAEDQAAATQRLTAMREQDARDAELRSRQAGAESPRDVQAKIDAMNQYGQVNLPLMRSGQIKRSDYFRGLLERVLDLPPFIPGRDLKLINVRSMLDAATQVEGGAMTEERYQAIRSEVIASEAQAYAQQQSQAQAPGVDWRHVISGAINGGVQQLRHDQKPPPTYLNCTSAPGVGGTVQTNCTQSQLQH